MKILSVALGAVFLIGAVGIAPADALVWIGDPIPSGSWGQRFKQQSDRDFDFVRIDIRSYGGRFEGPTFRNLSEPDWSSPWDHESRSSIRGGSKLELDFEIHFDAPAPGPVSFNLACYKENERKDCYRVDFDGHDWAIDNDDDWNPGCDDVDIPPVPEPSSLLLLASGLLGGALASRKIRRHS